jgi:formamidopyrimidine-DNA glycosylase
MPELPDITVYLEHLQSRVVGQPLEKVAIAKPFVLRSFDPPVSELEGTIVRGVRRMGKRIVLAMDGERFIVIHLMIAGRLRWRSVGAKLPPKGSILATFHFPNGVLVLTEAGTTRRASMHLVRGEAELAEFDRGGLEVLDATLAEFEARLRSENHTLKRALADPRLFSGIGNAYSDEILHRARLSPVTLTSRLSDDDIDRLFEATRATLSAWTERLRT